MYLILGGKNIFECFVKLFICRKPPTNILCSVYESDAHNFTGSAAWIFISIALNSTLTFQGSNNFQHKAVCFQSWAIPLALYILVAHYGKCGLLFHCACVRVWGNATHSDCAVVYTARRRCSQSQHFRERNRELSHMQPHHKSNCNSQINCSVTQQGAPASLSHTPLWACVCVLCYSV